MIILHATPVVATDSSVDQPVYVIPHSAERPAYVAAQMPALQVPAQVMAQQTEKPAQVVAQQVEKQAQVIAFHPSGYKAGTITLRLFIDTGCTNTQENHSTLQRWAADVAR